MASAAVQRAQERRVGAAQAALVRWQWKVQPVLDTVAFTMKERITLATHYLVTKVVSNISRPVTKTPVVRTVQIEGKNKKRQSTRVTNRSKPGEFPKADTTRLMHDVGVCNGVVEEAKGSWMGYVGTTLAYGLILEISETLDRKFLTRTMNEERDKVMKMLNGPIKA